MAYTTINKPTDYFDTNLVTGTTADQNITGMNFQPDWIWSKQRNATDRHRLVDSIRGTGKALYSDRTDSEATESNISSFNSDGYTLVGGSGMNENTSTYAQWCWLAAGSASSNTDGSINSSVSANTTAGFSIVSYTGNSTGGATVGHGLGSVPNWIIVKDRDNARSWTVYHQGIGNTHGIYLNANSNKDDDSVYWNDTTPSSSVFTLGSSNETNASASMIAYCFAEKKGYSKFGSYTGNGNANGTFVYTGFKPAWILVKQTTGASQNWYLWDNKRDSFNLADTPLKPDEALAESGIGAYNIDMLSNGFKFRGTEIQINANGETYIYMAFAESPFVTSTGIPTTAR